ncbi:hypothetical protein VUR80DRAFT_8893 [Thermomyces stellatus]
MPTTECASRTPARDLDPACTRPSKRRRIDDESALDNTTAHHISPGRDRLSALSDELLIRILSHLPLRNLLGLSPVSHRFYRLSSDSQLWRQLYYLHFVLPRAMRIPGFRPSAGLRDSPASSRMVMRHSGADLWRHKARGAETVDWKRQYKLRHNWSRGKCAVQELDVGGDPITLRPARKQTLAKIVDGIAVTADVNAGLRAWDLKTKKMLAQIGLRDMVPTCMAVDEQDDIEGRLEIALGFLDGGFGVWGLDRAGTFFTERYCHPASTNGKLVSVAYAFPYLMTATENVLVSLYAFDADTTPGAPEKGDGSGASASLGETSEETLHVSLGVKEVESERDPESSHTAAKSTMTAPYLMTSLRSHSSKAPLALSVRKMATWTTAAIAYTLPTREGWTIGIQELHITGARARLKTPPEVSQSRLAYAPPIVTGRSLATTTGSTSSETDDSSSEDEYGPMALCYTHPYLLATLPDNTLILYLCTTNATSLSLSRGIRLWGHTSGIGDAEITSRGKAVSVSCRGDELRVWELEGRTGGRSVEIRASSGGGGAPGTSGFGETVLDDKRSWVGFDDEMVIVLKEARSGRESLVVYDFS